MLMLSESFELYIALVCAASYFIISAVVFSYMRKGVRRDLMESFGLFGLFALLHGIADTAGVLGAGPLRLAFAFASWAVLLRFSLKILIRDDQARADLSKYVYLVYAVSIVLLAIELLLKDPDQAIVSISVIFGFPISLMAGAAFLALARRPGIARIKTLHLLFNGIAFCFALFALLPAVPLFWDTAAGFVILRILRATSTLALAGFTVVALSGLRSPSKAPVRAPAYFLN